MRVAGSLALCICTLGLTSVVAEEKDKLDPAKLVGTWTYVSGERSGDKVPDDRLKVGTVVINKETFTLKGADTFVMGYKLDTSKNPCAVTLTIKEGPQGVGAVSEGIIAVKGDELTLCYAMPMQAAPKEFSAKKDSGNHLFVLKRMK